MRRLNKSFRLRCRFILFLSLRVEEKNIPCGNRMMNKYYSSTLLSYSFVFPSGCGGVDNFIRLRMSPEFLINLRVVPGLPLGRIFVPNSYLTKRNFLSWYNSVEIYRITHYPSGNVIWFFAPISEYRRLASAYPHHRHSAYTHYLLNSASPFFRSLKPPYLPDDEYLN